MLELTRPYGEPLRPFLSPMVTYAIAHEAWELRAYAQLRQQIFCEEQGLFADCEAERDAHDLGALPIVAVAHCAGTPDRVVGVVRIFEQALGVWYGGRLAVEPIYRTRRAVVGGGLIKKAVQSACARGCSEFLATVQQANARYFERFHFRPLRAIEVCGRPHVLMRAELSAFGGAQEASAS